MKTLKQITILVLLSIISFSVYSQNLTPKLSDKGKFGYVNEEGKWKIKAKYTDAKAFDESGFAIVKKDDKSGLINKSGKEIFKPKFEEIIYLPGTGDFIAINKKKGEYFNSKTGYVVKVESTQTKTIGGCKEVSFSVKDDSSQELRELFNVSAESPRCDFSALIITLDSKEKTLRNFKYNNSEKGKYSWEELSNGEYLYIYPKNEEKENSYLFRKGSAIFDGQPDKSFIKDGFIGFDFGSKNEYINIKTGDVFSKEGKIFKNIKTGLYRLSLNSTEDLYKFDKRGYFTNREGSVIVDSNGNYFEIRDGLIHNKTTWKCRLNWDSEKEYALALVRENEEPIARLIHDDENKIWHLLSAESNNIIYTYKNPDMSDYLVSLFNGDYLIRDNGKYGVIDIKTGKTNLPVEYDLISLVDNGFTRLDKGNISTYKKKDRTITLDNRLYKISDGDWDYWSDAFVVTEVKTGKKHLRTDKGESLTKKSYDWIGDYVCNDKRLGLNYIIGHRAGTKYLINKDGNEIASGKDYEYLVPYSGKPNILVTEKYVNYEKRQGIIDSKTGAVLVPCKYYKILATWGTADGYHCVSEVTSHNYGYLHVYKRNKIIHSVKVSTWSLEHSFEKIVAKWFKDANEWGLYDISRNNSIELN